MGEGDEGGIIEHPPYVQAMGGGNKREIDENGEIKVKGDASMTFREEGIPSARFWLKFHEKTSTFFFTIKRVAKDVVLTQS